MQLACGIVHHRTVGVRVIVERTPTTSIQGNARFSAEADIARKGKVGYTNDKRGTEKD